VIAADIDWIAVGAVAGGVAAIFGIPTALFAAVTARQAKRQAGAAEDSADAAKRMAKLAEDEQKRATEPLLRIARYPNGIASVQVNETLDDVQEHRVTIQVQNGRDVAAEITGATLNGERGQFLSTRAVGGDFAIISFPIASIGPRGDERGETKRLSADIHVPESGRRGTFSAAIWLQGGHWHAGDEQLQLDD